MIKEILKKYFEKGNVKYYLPLIESLTKKDHKGRAKIEGAMSNFKQEDYEKLNKKEKVMAKYQDKEYEYKLKTEYEKADYYELNMNVIEECIIIFDIDEEINEEEKETWIKNNIPEKEYIHRNNILITIIGWIILFE